MYPELPFPVDQYAFRRLTGVNCKTTRETLGRVLVEPVAKEDNVGSEIVVVKVAVRVFAWWLTYYDTSVETVYFL